jgi:2-polyprenyl-3-methyl-5-hydroxy-6-metoxy-1,4-benzoquinol methylase
MISFAATVLRALKRLLFGARDEPVLSDAECRQQLERQYAVVDPWKMASEREQLRFAETNRILRERLIAPAAQVESILEIGCGEGHQSEHLARLCRQLTGIDVVPTAIARASVRLPGAALIAGDLHAQPWIENGRTFDIVTACEVLYYLEDIPRMLRAMSRLGRACLVTHLRPSTRVARALAEMPIAGSHTFADQDVAWEAVWWRNPP